MLRSCEHLLKKPAPLEPVGTSHSKLDFFRFIPIEIEIDKALLIVLDVVHNPYSLYTPKEWICSENAKGSLYARDPNVGKFVSSVVFGRLPRR